MHSDMAVESITLSSRCSTSMKLTSGSSSAVGVGSRIAGVDAVGAVLAHQDGAGIDLDRPQRRRGVGGEERIAGTSREDHHPTLLEVADGAAADVRLGDLRHVDRGLDTGRLTGSLEGLLQGQRVDHRGEHAHVVGLGAVHASALAGHPTPDVPAPDHDRDVDVEASAWPRLDLRGEIGDHLAVDAESAATRECLTGQLDQDS